MRKGEKGSLLKNSKNCQVLIKRFSAFLILLSLVFPLLEAHGEEPAESREEITIEYGSLKELLKQGNVTLKQSIGDYKTNIADYQRIWDIMKWEQGNMEDQAEEAEDAVSEDALLYSSNASMLKSSANHIYKQIESMTNEKSTKSLEAAADSYTMAAQTIMNSYNQMAQNVEAREKSVEAIRAVYEENLKMQSIGSATLSDVNEAQNALSQALNSLEALKEQEAQLRTQLLNLLGFEDTEEVIIGEVPEPDLAAIEAIDLEGDKEKAVGNSASVIEARHTSANGTSAVNRRFNQVNEAEGKAEAEIEECYEEILVKKTEYEAALSAWNSAVITYDSLQRKKQAGLLDRASYLQGEADYSESLAKLKTASMSLVSAYESYCWLVKGVTS